MQISLFLIFEYRLLDLMRKNGLKNLPDLSYASGCFAMQG